MMDCFQTLNLAFNHIRELDVGFLATLVSLEVLHLEGNGFLAMPTAALKGLDKLKVLTLQENDIGKNRVDKGNMRGIEKKY